MTGPRTGKGNGAESLDRVVEEAAQQAERLKRLADEIERRRREAEGEGRSFTAPTPEQLLKKLRKTESPMVQWQSWTPSVPPGGTLLYEVGIYNPDPIPWFNLFTHVFVGPATLAVDVGQAVAAVDPRFPRLTMPAFGGLGIDPGRHEALTFEVPIPTGIELSNYLGNAFLFQADWHDPALYLDRGLFVFGIT